MRERDDDLLGVHARDRSESRPAATVCGIRVALAEYITDTIAAVTCPRCLAILRGETKSEPLR